MILSTDENDPSASAVGTFAVAVAAGRAGSSGDRNAKNDAA